VEERRNDQYSEDVAHRAVKQVFAILGVDVDDPKEVEEFRKDLRFGQSMRRTADRGMLAFVGVVAAAMVYALFAGITTKIQGGP
jgi:hypothetical protein